MLLGYTYSVICSWVPFGSSCLLGNLSISFTLLNLLAHSVHNIPLSAFSCPQTLVYVPPLLILDADAGYTFLFFPWLNWGFLNLSFQRTSIGLSISFISSLVLIVFSFCSICSLCFLRRKLRWLRRSFFFSKTSIESYKCPSKYHFSCLPENLIFWYIVFSFFQFPLWFPLWLLLTWFAIKQLYKSTKHF